VLNVDIPVIYIMVSVHMHVKSVIRPSLKSTDLQDINAYIVVSVLIFVKFVTGHSVIRAIL